MIFDLLDLTRMYCQLHDFRLCLNLDGKMAVELADYPIVYARIDIII
jgi:hypothetical protein